MVQAIDKLVKTKQKDKLPLMYILLWLGAFGVNIKSIFTNFDVDGSYAIAMAYRHITGDSMFIDMWEPHQTSSFLLDLQLWLFNTLTGSFEGCVLFLQAFGVLIFATIALLIVNVFSNHVGKKAAHLMAIFFFTFRPKQLLITEFSNMTVIFSTLLIITLIKYFEFQNGIKWLIMTAFLTFFLVLSYPSSILSFLAILICITIFSEKKIIDILWYSLSCFFFGIAYLSLFSVINDVTMWKESILNILGGDSSHMEKASNLFLYFKEFIEGSLWIILVFALSVLITFLLVKIKGKTKSESLLIGSLFFSILLLVSDCVLLFYNNGKPSLGVNEWRYIPAILFIPVNIWCLIKIKEYENSTLKRLLICGSLLALSLMFAVLILTNLSFVTTINYCSLAGMVSIPVLLFEAEKKNLFSSRFFSNVNAITILLLMFLCHNFLLIKDYSASGSLVTNIENIVRSGPAKGIMCGYMGYYKTMASQEAFRQNIIEGQPILIVQNSVTDSLLYMYRNNTVSHYSTISTTTYNDKLEEYWSSHPQKRPTTIALECWFDNMIFSENSWIMTTIADQYELTATSDYWYFYSPKR